MIGLFRLPISSWFSFGIFLETCPFFLSYLIFWHIIVDSILFCLGRLVGWLYFCGSSCDFCSFHFSFYSFGSLLFSSWWVLSICSSSVRFINFVCYFKEPTHGCIDFLFFCFFNLYSINIYFLLIFIISFLLLTLSFLCFLFLIVLDGGLCWISCLFEIFLVSWRPVLLWTSL